MIFIYWLDSYDLCPILHERTFALYRPKQGTLYEVTLDSLSTEEWQPLDWQPLDFLDYIGQRARFDADFGYQLGEVLNSQQAVWDLIDCCKELDTLSWA